MTSQLDMFAGDDPVVNVTVARSESMNALELLMTWKRNLDELMNALPASVFLSKDEKWGRIRKWAKWCYCLSPRQDGRPGSWPVVCIDDAAKDEDRHPATIINHGNMIIVGYTQKSVFGDGIWQIRTEHSLYDLTGRFVRSLNKEMA